MADSSDRLQKLLKMLEKDPADTFLLYAVALEHKKANDFPKALEFLQRVVEKDAGYCGAYQQAGQVYEMAGDADKARKAYRDGIKAATDKGDTHARSEMETALAMLG